MKRKSLRQFFAIVSLLAFYLLGSHAGAHGLAWCLGAEGHAHLVKAAAACHTSTLHQPCGSANFCAASALAQPPLAPQQSECQHLPVNSLHAPLAQNILKADKLSPPDATPAGLPPLWRQQVATRRTVVPSLAASLPPTQSLAALRSVVLLN
jgi:hypothetical protein